MVQGTVKSMPMARRALAYWSDSIHHGSICLGCGKNINYDEEIALVAVQVPLPAHPSKEELEGVEKFPLCPDCGTNVDRLVQLGMRRIIDLEVEDPHHEILDDVDLEKPYPGEEKN